MNIIFQIPGGRIDKNIAATAVCRIIKNTWPGSNLIVISEFPDIFLCNPFVYKVFAPSETTYFYNDYVVNEDAKFFLHDPEKESDYIQGKCSLIESWCNLIGLTYNGEIPEMFLSERERSFMVNKIKKDKPIFLIQTNHINYSNNNHYTWFYDLPMSTAQQIVNHFAQDYNVVHIRGEKQLKLNNVSEFSGDIRTTAALMLFSEKQLLIDDYCQHLAIAMNKQSVVCWTNLMQTRRGYSSHINIMGNAPKCKVDWTNIVFDKNSEQDRPPEFSYANENEIFNVNEIIHTIKKSNVNDLICNRILAECNRNSMVAKRLYYLINRFSFNNVAQILDIGSWHLGQSIEFAAIFPDAKIDAFEPVPDSYNLCKERLSQLVPGMRKRIAVHNIAIGETIGEIPFYPVVSELSSVPNIGASSMFQFIDGLNGTPFGQNLVQEEIRVRSTTLDTWCHDNNISEIDILWMDVQGAELLVLQGGANILRNTKVIMTEVGLKAYYNGHTLKTDIDAFLVNLGFRELEDSYEINVADYEANTIYVRL